MPNRRRAHLRRTNAAVRCLPLSLVLTALFCLILPPALSADNSGRPLRVQRYRNLATRAHLFTTDSEFPQAERPELAREEVPDFLASTPLFYVFTEPYAHTIPVHRFRARDGSMHFAPTAAEHLTLRNRGLQEIGDPVYVYDRQVEGASEVFRVQNPADGDVLYTTSAEEKDFYRSRGWLQLDSLGYAQSAASSGTGILQAGTVKLEPSDYALITRTYKAGQKIVFGRTNPKIDALLPGTALYSEKNYALPLGLVAKVVAVSRLDSGETQVETAPVELDEIFEEFHLYLDNRQIYFFPPEIAAGLDGWSTVLPLAARPRTAPAPVRPPGRDSLAGARIPEYLSAAHPEALDANDWSNYWSKTFDFTQNLYHKVVGSRTTDITVTASLTIDATAEVLYTGYNTCVINPKAIFLLTPHESGSVTVTATGDISKSDEINVLKSIPAINSSAIHLGSFTTPVGVPVNFDFELYAGYDASATITATLTGKEDGRMTTGVQYDIHNNIWTPLKCNDPCPAGMACGTPPSSTLFCGVTPTLSGTLSVDGQAAVYVKPKLFIYAGLPGLGIGPYAYAKLQLLAKLEPPNINAYAQLIPGLGVEAKAGCYKKDIWSTEFSPVWQYNFLTIPLAGVTSFKINNGAATTASRTVTLNNIATGNPTQYMASESSGFSGASWQPYSLAPSFTLSAGTGLKTVYFKVQTTSGASVTVSSTITLVGPPSVSTLTINNGATTTASRTVTLNNTVSGSPTQYMASESSSFSDASWQTYSTAPSFTLSASAGAKTVFFKVQNAAGASSPVSAKITLTGPPSVSTLSINNGATTTASRTVTLNNTVSGSPTQYMASESSSFSDASWQTYSTAPSFTLSAGAGAKTVYFKVQNAAGASSPVSAKITLTGPPSVSTLSINNGATTTTSRTVTLNNTATGSPTQYMASESSSFSGASWQAYSTAPSFTLSAGGGTKTVYFKVQNASGASSAVSKSITLTVAPTLTAFSINSGAATTTNRTVTLNNSASDSPSQYIASESASFSGASWQTYSTSPSFTLSTTKGTKTVYLKVKNAAGESASRSAQIQLK